MITFFWLGVINYVITSSTAFPITKNDNEGRDFWMEKGQNELKRILRLTRNERIAKNVILFIGDGMGINTITPSRIYKGQKQGNPGEEGSLFWESFPTIGLSKTYNTDYQVSDSAGTATAIYSGVKTRMGMLGLDNSVKHNSCDPEAIERAKLTNIIHWAIAEGKETGIVTTTRLTHATPGAAYAHVTNRNWESDVDVPEMHRGECPDIAKQLVYSYPGNRINVLFGGGSDRFRSQENGGMREDEDLVDSWKETKSSFKFLSNSDDLKKWNKDQSDYVLGLFSKDHTSYEFDRDPKESPSLTDMTEAAVKRLLKSKNGFVLIVESGRIDHAHHDNMAKRAFEEVLSLESAVEAAKGLTNENETLIIVTADHSHSMTMNGYPTRGNDIMGYVYDEERTKGFMSLPDGRKQPYTTISYANGPGFYDHFKNGSWVDVRTVDTNDINFRQPALWEGPENYETHGGEDAPLYAIGPMAHLFSGVFEQNYIAHVIGYAACIGNEASSCQR